MPTATLLTTCDDVAGVYLSDQSCRWGITTSAGSYIPAWHFYPPMQWDTNIYKDFCLCVVYLNYE